VGVHELVDKTADPGSHPFQVVRMTDIQLLEKMTGIKKYTVYYRDANDKTTKQDVDSMNEIEGASEILMKVENF
jgi:hypothetical protein